MEWRNVVGHGFALVLGAVFSAAGAAKLMLLPQAVERIGYSEGFVTGLGITELIIAPLVLLPFTRLVGSGLILTILVGALGTHILHAQWLGLLVAAVLIPMALGAGLLR